MSATTTILSIHTVMLITMWADAQYIPQVLLFLYCLLPLMWYLDWRWPPTSQSRKPILVGIGIGYFFYPSFAPFLFSLSLLSR